MARNLQTDITIQRATPADAPIIATIHVETWRTAYQGLIPEKILAGLDVSHRTAFWKDRISQTTGHVFVAKLNGTVIGFCDLIPSRDQGAAPQTVAEIAAFYILPAHWRNGAGSLLILQAVAEARKQDYTSVTLWVLTSNTSARKFYEKNGFTTDKEIRIETLKDGTELHETRYHRSI